MDRTKFLSLKQLLVQSAPLSGISGGSPCSLEPSLLFLQMRRLTPGQGVSFVASGHRHMPERGLEPGRALFFPTGCLYLQPGSGFLPWVLVPESGTDPSGLLPSIRQPSLFMSMLMGSFGLAQLPGASQRATWSRVPAMECLRCTEPNRNNIHLVDWS